MTVERLFNLEEKDFFASWIVKNALTSDQAYQVELYLFLLLEWCEKINLTSLETIKDILMLHFQDSFALADEIDLNKFHHMADVGTGAGFPGLALKILFPHLKLTLIEVNQKKRLFLSKVIETLGLVDVEISELDWRTFLRKTNKHIDLFVSRAALAPDELIRVFKPTSHYNNAIMVYWASSQWKASLNQVSLIDKEVSYKIENRVRRLIFFKKDAEMKKGQL